MIYRLFPFLVASIALATPTAADYRACMEFCTKEHAFGHCNDVCSGQAANRPSPSPGTQPGSPTPPAPRAIPPASAPAPKAAESPPPIPDVLKGRDCSTPAGKADAAFAYILGRHDPQDASAFPAGDPWDGETFRVGFFVPQKQHDCTGFITITDDCRVSEDLKCEFATE